MPWKKIISFILHETAYLRENIDVPFTNRVKICPNSADGGEETFSEPPDMPISTYLYNTPLRDPYDIYIYFKTWLEEDSTARRIVRMTKEELRLRQHHGGWGRRTKCRR